MFNKNLAYWQNKLSRLPVLELTTDKLRSPHREYHVGIETFVFPEELYESVKTLSQSSNILILSTLLTVFKCLLHKYTGEEDIIVGSYISQSNNLDFNTLAFRSCVSGDISFLELLKQVNEVVNEDLKHQEFPWNQLVEKLSATDTSNYASIFQVMFSLQDADAIDTPLPINVDKFQSDLAFFVVESKEGLKGTLAYNQELFEAQTIKRLIGHFENLLTCVVENPELKVNQLKILSEVEYDQIVTEWNNTAVDYPQDKCIHQLFEQKVAETPDAIAVIFQEQQLTYRELDNRANHLANYLQTLGLKPDTLVGICINRCLETDDLLTNGSQMLEKCREWELTVLYLPTAYWHQLTSDLAIGEWDAPPSLRLVIIGGEAVIPEKVKTWQTSFKDNKYPELINTYGPTEATVVVTRCKLSECINQHTQSPEMTIGKPFDNVKIYILDKSLNPVPIGVPGELYIGGVSVSRGSDKTNLNLQEEYLSANNDVEQKLVDIWEQAFRIQPIGIKDNFFSLGGNSLMATSMVAQIEKVFNKKFTSSIFLKASTIEELAKIIAQEETIRESAIKINYEGKKIPLFIIANNGFLYQQMIDYLDREQPVYILQQPLDKAPEMASRCIEQIRNIQPQGPYNLMGHSYEGLVTYEVAQQLYAQNEQVAFLGMLDTPTPEVENRAEEARLLFKRYQRLKVVLDFSWKDKTSFFKERIEYRLSESFQPLIPTLSKFTNEYKIKPLPGKINLFIATFEFYGLEDGNFGWNKWATQVDIYKIPGTHRSMLLKPENAQMLAKQLSNCLK